MYSKFNIGDEVIIKATQQKVTIMEVLADKMYVVMEDDVDFIVYENDMDFTFLFDMPSPSLEKPYAKDYI